MIAFSYLREPIWLLLALVPSLLVIAASILKQRRANAYADPKFNDWVTTANTYEHKHRYRQLLFIQLAWLAFAIAIAGPRLPEKISDTQQQYNKDVLVVLDVSLSMSARDLRPSRLERAKLELLDLVERMNNMRLGIVVYAANPHLLTPPTTDKHVLKYYIQSLRAQLLPTEGSGTFKALQYGIQTLTNRNTQEKHQSRPGVIILVTDGEVNQPATEISKSIDQLSNDLKQNDIYLYTLGVGSPQGAPLLSPQSGWLEHENQAIVSQLNESLLVRLANLGNGHYSAITDDDSDWIQLYNNGIAKLSYQTVNDKLIENIIWQEKYHWFVIAGALFLILGLWQPQLRKPALSSHAASMTVTSLLMACLVLTSSLATTKQAHAADNTYLHAYEDYLQGDYQAAREGFASVTGYAGRFAEGSMSYHLGQYQMAVPAFIQATLDADTDKQRINAVFNLANCYFKLEEYSKAEQLYRDVLRYRKDYVPAIVNLKYATALKQEAQANKDIIAQSQGKGPRTADAPKEMDITTGKLTLGDSESAGDENNRQRREQTPSYAVQEELAHSAPASEKIEQNQDLSWTYEIGTLEQLLQRNPRVHTDESVLWQRMFEYEEDFEAAQEQPTTLPGVKPW